jgi:AcrR family transcriptional regulator
VPPSTRDRIVTATNERFRRTGYHATSLSDISGASGATIGSIYHFFPGGKRELAAATITESAASYRQLFEDIAAEAGSPPAAVTAFFDGAAAVLEETDFLDICPIGTVAREVASTDDELRAATADAFAGWIDAATDRFGSGGVDHAEARALAGTVVALLEGSFVLARAARDAEVVRTAGRHARALVEAALPASGAAGAPGRSRTRR